MSDKKPSFMQMATGEEPSPWESQVDNLASENAHLRDRLAALERVREAAETLSRIYFEIASEVVGEEKVRKLRDQRLAAAPPKREKGEPT